MSIPTYDELMNPTLRALKQLGGSGSVQEIEDAVANLLNLSERDANQVHRGNRTKLGYRLAWARNYLKRYGLLENSSRGVWALTQKGSTVKSVDGAQVRKAVKRLGRLDANATDGEPGSLEAAKPASWEQRLIDKILRLSPKQFECLCQRLLRESGFTQVEVTGRSGDGGIDGKGMMRVGGFLIFRVVFQCKRYKGSVPAKQVRDFRGAMFGKADKALLITTGKFSREAIQEATREGAPPIDLVDGEQLAQKMKELDLGIKKTMQEVVVVDSDWFERFKE